MRTRARAALGLAACLAAGPLPLAPAAAAECVKVVVDYGTVSGYGTPPSSIPNTRCVAVGDDAVAAEAIQGRARYKGNFLCALDGYPKDVCGDHGTEPYWSFWVFRDGRWVYASEGVATYRVGDTDGDGHPDPLGFRFVAFDGKAPPRANPAYPKPAPTTKPPAPPATTAPPRSGSGPGSGPTAAPGATTGTTTRTGSGGTTRTSAPTAPDAARATAAPPPASAAASTAAASPTTPPAAPLAAAPGTGATDAAPQAGPAQAAPATPDAFPWGTVAGGALALGLLAAAALRFRTPGAP